jgi:hypothetical protein
MTLTAKLCLAMLLPAILLLSATVESQDTNPSAASAMTRGVPRKSNHPSAVRSRTSKLPSSGTLQSQAKGFDMQLAPAEAQMWTWWLDSPYSDIGVYFGGCNDYLEQFVIDGQPSPDQCGTKQISPVNTKQANYNLNNNWLASVADQGWGVMPIWVGPQAANADGSPCVNNYNTNPQWLMLTDGSTSGTAEAINAMARAEALGVSSGIIYYDMEAYNSSTCSAEVIVFLNDWTNALQASGFKAGIYGNLSNVGDFSSIAPAPDAFWLAGWGLNGIQWNWQTAALAEIGSYLNPLWTNTAWQYCSDKTSTPCSGGNPKGDNWGNVPLSIDGDVENTLVLPYGSNRFLPPTTLISPANGATEQSTTPNFSWAPAQDAIQYSLAIATSISALPTGTQTICPACTFFSVPITTTSYTLASGILQLGTTYYWEVQADSGVYKGGNWSSPYSFTTGGNATKIQSVSVNPSSFGSGSYTLLSVTLNGIAPSSGITVTLTSSNRNAFPPPPSVEVLAGQNTASASVLSGSVSTSTTVTVRASYNGTQTATVVITPISGTTTTSAASSIIASGAVTNGTINPQGDAGYAGFYWGTDPTMTVFSLSCTFQFWTNCPSVTANSSTQSFTSTLTGLSSNTTYYFQMVFNDSNNDTLQYGAILSFTTQ